MEGNQRLPKVLSCLANAAGADVTAERKEEESMINNDGIGSLEKLVAAQL